MMVAIGLLTLAVLSWAGCETYRRVAVKRQIVDVETLRSSHVGSVPRGGGVVFVSLALGTLMLGSLVWPPARPLIWCAALTGGWLVWAISFWDDLHNVSVGARFGAQACALVLVMLPCLEHPSLAQVPALTLTGLFILGLIGGVWTINLYNFMDGTDGIAATQGIVVLATYGGAAWLLGLPVWSLICAALAAVLAGFLVLNWPRAKLFMGDSGSATLGYLVAVLIGFGALHDLALGAAAFISIASFSLDATLTLVKRIYDRERLSEPHRSHVYQRLARALGSHVRLLLVWHAWNFVVLLPLVWAGVSGKLNVLVAIALAYGLTSGVWLVLHRRLSI